MEFIRKSLFRLMLVLVTVFVTLSTYAQSDPSGKSPVTRTYAITNIHVTQAPGRVVENGTIIIKDGLIHAVGTNITIPSDAAIIKGDSMYAYAGFIDGMSHTGLKKPKQMERPKNISVANPPNNYAGIQPEKQIVDQLDIESSTIGNMRKQGFTISHTVPHGRMFPGSGSLILLADKKHLDGMILKSNTSMYTQFKGAPRVYPSNILGIMAKWRGMYRNATYAKQNAQLSAQNPTGVQRPNHDRAITSFYPVIDGQKPVFFNVSKILDIRRVLRLKNDLNIPVISIGNIKEGWDLVDDLKGSNAHLFLSLDLPKSPKESKEDDKSDEVKALESRRMDFYKKYVSQAGVMEKAGVSFGFSSMDTKPADIKKNLMAMIENGLSEDAALAALTTNAAGLLGIESMAGTIEAGKLGNLVVSNAPYFSKDSQIKYVFVDGNQYEYEIKKKSKKTDKKKGAGVPVKITGTWSFTVDTPGEKQEGKIVLKKDGDNYTGIISTGDDDDEKLKNIKLEGDKLSFDFMANDGQIPITVAVKIEGNTFSGAASAGQFGAFDIEGTKDDE